MSGIFSLMKSRKAWLTFLGILVTIIGPSISLSPEQVYMIAGLLAVLVMAIMGEDVTKNLKVETDEDKEKLMVKAKEISEKLNKPKEEKKEEKK